MTSKLLKYTREDKDLFYTLDLKDKEEYQDDLSLGVSLMKLEESFLDYLEPKKRELIDLYSKKNNLERIAFLSAKGVSKNNKWHYWNEEKLDSVQKWINKNDGNYKLLILNVDNPNQEEIYSRKSIIMAPNREFELESLKSGFVQAELFVPETGYINSYSIDSEIKKLKE